MWAFGRLIHSETTLLKIMCEENVLPQPLTSLKLLSVPNSFLFIWLLQLLDERELCTNVIFFYWQLFSEFHKICQFLGLIGPPFLWKMEISYFEHLQRPLKANYVNFFFIFIEKRLICLQSQSVRWNRCFISNFRTPNLNPKGSLVSSTKIIKIQ